MSRSEALKKAQKKYTAAHYTNISVRVSIQEAAAIRAACALLNTTASTVARRALLTIAESAGTLNQGDNKTTTTPDTTTLHQDTAPALDTTTATDTPQPAAVPRERNPAPDNTPDLDTTIHSKP